ncbi:MAG: DUF1828 domain-containing protein [Acidimicrobiia bacterium]|nr:DUF1828 domain-containing protein [Acidimicrobiia bacterium]MYG72375.1 DUF1828 domain-containing protein [Acidimicrobiia bacterium]
MILSSEIRRLTNELRESFLIRTEGDNGVAITSPLLFDDGDVLPVFAQCEDGRWSLTDHGIAISHLFFDEFAYTEARFKRIMQLVDYHSAELSPTNEITLQLHDFPRAYDVGTFLQLVAQVQGVALMSQTDRDQIRYVTTLRTSVKNRLKTPSYNENWSPPEIQDRTRANYRADLQINSGEGADVVLFAASTSDKANVSALTMGQFKRLATERQFLPVLAYHPERVASEAVYRFQDEVEDMESVVPTELDNYRELVGILRKRGIEMTDA